MRADGRKHVIIYDHETKKRRTQSYPRYIMEQLLGRALEDWETVDHIDEDFTNDDPANLQILSRSANAAKSAFNNGRFYNCSNEDCELEIWRTPSQVQNTVLIFCSNKCRAKVYGKEYARVAQLVEASDLSSDQ